MQNKIDEGIELHQRALFFLSKTDSNAEKIETYARLGLLYELKSEFKKSQGYLFIGNGNRKQLF